MIDTAKLYDYRNCCPELLAWLESSRFPLLAKYKKLRKYYNNLKKKITILNDDFLSA